MSDYNELMEIIKGIAALQPDTGDDMDLWCHFCNEWWIVPSDPQHADDCLWVRCKEIVEDMDV